MRMKIIVTIIYILIFFIIEKNFYQLEYFVDKHHPNTSDNNNGTSISNPFQTIKKASEIVQAGDIVTIKSGEYHEGPAPSWSEPTNNPKNSGTRDNPIMFRAFKGDLVVYGSNFGVAGRDYVVFEGFKTTHIKMFGCEGCVVRYCLVVGKYADTTDNHDGIRIQNTKNCTIQYSIITGVKGNSANSAGIKFYDTEETIIEDNFVYGNTVGIFDKDSGIKNTFRRNLIKDNDDIQFYGNNQDKYATYYIYDNVIYGSISLHSHVDVSFVHDNLVFSSTLAGAWAGDIFRISLWNNILISKSDDCAGFNDGKLVLTDQLTYMDYNLYNCTPSYDFDYYNAPSLSIEDMRGRGFENNAQIKTISEIFVDEIDYKVLPQWETAGRYGDQIGPGNVALILDTSRYGASGNLIKDFPIKLVLAILIPTVSLLCFVIILICSVIMILYLGYFRNKNSEVLLKN